MQEALVAVFDTPTHTDQAVRALEAAGVPAAAIRRYHRGDAAIPHAGQVGVAPSTTQPRPDAETGGGFWSWLLGEETSRDPAYDYDQDERLYTRSIESGNTVIAVYVDPSDADRVMRLIAEQNPMTLEDTGTASMAGTTGTTTAQTASTGTTGATRETTGTTGATRETTTARQTSRTGEKEETIPLSEERVDVGKRRVVEPVQIRRYTVERPVEQQVNLRDERIEIERRQTSGGAPGGAFEDRTVEVHETHEEPEVRRTAAKTEDVVVRKETTEHPETVRETARKEEVEVKRPSGSSKRAGR